MDLSRCLSALAELSSFKPGPVQKVRPRDFEQSVVLTEPPDQKDVQKYYWRHRQEIVSAASVSAIEIEKTEVAHWFAAHADQYSEYTNAESCFDLSRQAFLDALSSENLYLPDWVIPPSVRSGTTKPRIIWPHEPLPNHKRPNAITRLVRVKLDQVRWNLSSALDDVTQLLKVIENDSIRTSALAWQRQLFDLNNLDEEKHLFGCFLLSRCAQSRRSIDTKQELESVLFRCQEDWARYAEAIKKAAAFLVAELGNSPDATNRSAPVLQVCKSTLTWCQAPNKKKPDKFKFGPLPGNLKDLAEAICDNAGKEIDPRALKKLGEDKVVWIVKHRTQFYEVYFADVVLWSQSNAAWIQLKKDKKDRKKRK